MSPISSQLQKVRALIQKGWTREVLARNKNGTVVPPTAPDAYSWCLLGAFQAIGLNDHSPAYQFLETIHYAPVVFNDTECASQADMLSFLDMAIQSAP